jgi:predicted nucleotidyltransferase
MKIKIENELEILEKQENVTILFACESGSRGWGFPSPDSDYDVRFIYVHHQDAYLSIENKKDNLEIPITDILDISGWDIRKALKLIQRSNAVLFEWLQSPIVYCSRYTFRDELFQLAREYFSPRASMHHYLGLAGKTLTSNLGGDKIRIKHYFYVLRPLLAAMWISKFREIPPMEFYRLLPLVESPQLYEHIEILLKRKTNALEKDMVAPVPELHEFIETEYERCQDAAAQFPPFKMGPEPLDAFFRKMIQRSMVK